VALNGGDCEPTDAPGQTDTGEPGRELPAAEQPARELRARYRDTAGQIAIEWIKSLLIAFLLFLVIRTFLVEAYRIPTGSMEKTLLPGDFLLVNKAIYGAHVPFTNIRLHAISEPKRGDIVVFVPPHLRDQNFVKRLIGAPGDTVAMRDKALYVNGVRQREPYATYGRGPDLYTHGMEWQCGYTAERSAGEPCQPSRDNWGPIVVPPGRYLMLGDNRDDSEDSRYWGFARRSDVIGRPWIIYYSYEPDGTGTMPWFTAIRWHRIGDRPN
jgi:signal peptidase I